MDTLEQDVSDSQKICTKIIWVLLFCLVKFPFVFHVISSNRSYHAPYPMCQPHVQNQTEWVALKRNTNITMDSNNFVETSLLLLYFTCCLCVTIVWLDETIIKPFRETSYCIPKKIKFIGLFKFILRHTVLSLYL